MMKIKVLRSFRSLLKNKRGQGMLEYVLLLAVVAAVVMAFKKPIMDKFTDLTDAVGKKADEVVK